MNYISNNYKRDLISIIGLSNTQASTVITVTTAAR